MKRVGYDADTGRYIFQERGGSYWQGPQGSEYGVMRRDAARRDVPNVHAPGFV